MKKISINVSMEMKTYTEFRIEEYLLQLKIQWLAYQSQRYYISYIKNFIEYTWFKNIDDFNNIIKLRFGYYKLTDKWISNNTIWKYYKCIRKYYYFLKKIEISNKLLIDDLPNVKGSRSLPKSLSEEDVYNIREIIKKKYRKVKEIKDYIIFETFVNTWIRRSELANLKIEDINKTFIKIR